MGKRFADANVVDQVAHGGGGVRYQTYRRCGAMHEEIVAAPDT